MKAGVFIGANSGVKQSVTEAVQVLAHELVARNIDLVYGGASVGLMGTLADAVLQLNGHVIGVIPAVLAEKEISHPHLSELHHVDTMQNRKKLLAELSDFFIVMPGGLGTLEEFFEIWNAAKIGLHQKPIGLLNIDGYFDHLIQFIHQAIEAGFAKSSHLELLTISDDPTLLLNKIKLSVRYSSTH